VHVKSIRAVKAAHGKHSMAFLVQQAAVQGPSKGMHRACNGNAPA